MSSERLEKLKKTQGGIYKSLDEYLADPDKVGFRNFVDIVDSLDRVDRMIRLEESVPQPTHTIEQELEAGLKAMELHALDCMAANVPERTCTCHVEQPCTRIYLPDEEYLEYHSFCWKDGEPTDRDIPFHGIPVFRTNDLDIHFCTD